MKILSLFLCTTMLVSVPSFGMAQKEDAEVTFRCPKLLCVAIVANLALAATGACLYHIQEVNSAHSLSYKKGLRECNYNRVADGAAQAQEEFRMAYIHAYKKDCSELPKFPFARFDAMGKKAGKAHCALDKSKKAKNKDKKD